MDRLASECDIIFHLAAAVGVRLIVEQPVHTIEANVMGTEAVLQAALRYRARVLVASTLIIASGLVMTFHLGSAAVVRVAVVVHQAAVMLTVLGLAFRSRPPEPIPVAVVAGATGRMRLPAARRPIITASPVTPITKTISRSDRWRPKLMTNGAYAPFFCPLRRLSCELP